LANHSSALGGALLRWRNGGRRRRDSAIAELRLARRATPRRQFFDPHHAHDIAVRKGDEVTHPHRRMRALNAPAVHPHDAAPGQGLRARSIGREAREPEEFIESQAWRMAGSVTRPGAL